MYAEYYIKIYFNRSPIKTGKSKAISVHACSGPYGSRRLRLPHFMIIGI
jgi:hypothetical protein